MKLFLCMCLIYPSLGGKAEPFLRIAWAENRDHAQRKFQNALDAVRRDPYYASRTTGAIGEINHSRFVIEEAL
jgi:hypothetical protein